MMFISSAFLSPMRTSTSTPRLRKMSSAFGLNSSAMRTLAWSIPHPWFQASRARQRANRPVEPRGQGLQIAWLDRGAAPDARSPGGAERYDAASSATPSFSRIAARFLANSAWTASGSEVTRSSTTFRQTLVLLRIAAIGHEEIDPGRPRHPLRQHVGIGVRARLQRRETADAIAPISARRDSPRWRATTAY